MPVRVVNVRGMNKPEQRRGVVYVSRAFAGWPGHELANPFKLERLGDGVTDPAAQQAALTRARAACLAKYCDWLGKRPTLDADLAALWEQTEGGRKPLGCWCADWDGVSRPVPDCHAAILSWMLDRYERAGSG